MGQLWSDVLFALRTMQRSPGFTATAVVTLALGLGANAAIFSFIDGVLLKPMEFPEPEQIVLLWEKHPNGGRSGVSAANFLDWQDQNKVFDAIAATSVRPLTLTGSGQPQLLEAETVSAGYFDIFRVKPALGRTFMPGEDEPGKETVVILTHRCWQNRFGAAPNILGKKLILDGTAYTVIGVLPEGSSFDRRRSEAWVPMVLKTGTQARDMDWFVAVARLKPGVSIDQARANMDAISAQIAAAYPKIKKGWGVTVDSWMDQQVNSQLKDSLLVLMWAVTGVLLICCVNLANLLLARGAGRARELAIRTAVGASRSQIIRQLLTESVVLSAMGAVLGIAVGHGLFSAIQKMVPQYLLPSYADVGMDWRVLGFLAALAVVAGILFGLAPAWQLSRGGTAETLKECGCGAAGSLRRGKLRGALVVAEVALAFVLLVGAGLMIRSFQNLLNVENGFDINNIVTMSMPLSMEQNTDGPNLATYVHQVTEQVDALPGVRQAAITSALPMQGWGYGMPFRIGGHTEIDPSKRRSCFFKIVTPGYLPGLGIKLKKGRLLAESDVAGNLPVAVINERMISRYFDKDEEPLGKTIFVKQLVTGKRDHGMEVPWQVVGVVGNERTGGLSDEMSPGMYVPFAQSPVVGFGLLVRAQGDPLALTKAIQNQIGQINKNQPLTDIMTLEAMRDEFGGSNRMQTILLGGFAGLALLLAAIGIYGVLSYTTAQRTQELGVRAALGAQTSDLIGLVLRGGMVLTAIGLAIGLAGSFALTKLLSSLLFRMNPHDPWTLSGVLILLAAVALVACLIPALRATRVDPVTALRYE